jgi:hypothetical protein
MKENWQMDIILNASYDKDLFTNLVTDIFSTNQDWWESFFTALTNTLADRYERGMIDDKTKAAVTNFARAVEIKLRIDSWAAISASEWRNAFFDYLPWQWKWLEADIDSLRAWDSTIQAWTEQHLTDWYEYKPLFDRTYIYNLVNWYSWSSNMTANENNIPTWAKKKNTTTWYGDLAINTANSIYSPLYWLAYNLYDYFK